MPVPVPKKQPAHPVLKSNNLPQHGHQNPFHSLTTPRPVSPVGPPPSFGTREQWINSLPSWRRSKPRPTWWDEALPSKPALSQGLAFADNATAIKGCHAKACSPPNIGATAASDVDGPSEADDEMSPTAANQMDVDHHSAILSPLHRQDYERGAFTPVVEDQSPVGTTHDDDSSPVEPVTPFGEFVDRAVSAAFSAFPHAEVDDKRLPDRRLPVSATKNTAPSQDVVTPTATSGYKKLAEPLSEWVANFIWRACTTNVNPNLNVTGTCKLYATFPPSHLAVSIHSLLLSTLLQPSAVFLALWYIARLPISFLPVHLASEQIKELRFRSTLLGEEDMMDCETKEANAPFRLVVIGCMLANKWLDDHTFSNKTWHSISNVPIHILNQLESLALDIFTYDMSISSSDWSQWLTHLTSHHTYLSSPTYPQPIGRPSTNPQVIVRKAIDEIIQAQAARSFLPGHSQPIFLGVEERRMEKIEKEQATLLASAALSEIDLDENGPLRDEYLPKKRHNATGPGSRLSRIDIVSQDENSERQKFSQMELEKSLPPPAKWSPAGDEPILRECNRVNSRYVAVQPPAPSVPAVPVQFQVLAAYQRHQEVYSIGSWPIPQPNMSMGYLFDVHVPAPATQVAAPLSDALYTPCQVVLPIAPPPSHSRSQSLYVYDQAHDMQQQRMRSYSHSTRFDYHPHEILDGVPAPWTSGVRGQYDITYSQALPPFASYCGLGVANGYPPTWLRAA